MIGFIRWHEDFHSFWLENNRELIGWFESWLLGWELHCHRFAFSVEIHLIIVVLAEYVLADARVDYEITVVILAEVDDLSVVWWVPAVPVVRMMVDATDVDCSSVTFANVGSLEESFKRCLREWFMVEAMFVDCSPTPTRSGVVVTVFLCEVVDTFHECSDYILHAVAIAVCDGNRTVASLEWRTVLHSL